MRLKRLEAFGFKSFADRLKFDFEDGITGIVGPNGCGKSNVFEALRWVLGEQSAKSLRGGEMNDVIFKGTDRRKPLGYCEVVVTFDNTARTLPVDANEVSVGRRLYRKTDEGEGGEAEYFINRELCRLKDVRDLLMDTGIGTSSYCFIAQGQIARLLEANPKERRAVFEEAAGVSRYRKRKDKALARLDRVRRDLETLATVREDVDKRYRTVRSQATTARRYKRYQDELRRLRAMLALVDYQELLERKAALDEDLAGLREREAAAARRASEADARVRESETEDTDLDRRASEAEGLRSRAEVEAERLEAEIRNAEENAHTSSAEVGRLRDEITALDSQAEERAKDRARLEETRRAIESDRAAADEILDGLSRAARGAAARAGELAAEAKAQSDRAFEAVRARAEAQNAFTRAQSEHGSATARAEGLQGRLAGIDGAFRSARAKAEEAEGDFAGLSDGLEAAARETVEQKKRLRALEEGRARLGEAISDARAGLESLKTRLMLLEDLHRRGDGVPAGTRELVKASRRAGSGLGEIHGVVGNLLWAKPEARTAIETALGGRASDLLVESVATAKAAIDHLRARGLGRASFLPLDAMLPTLLVSDEFLAHEGVVGRACDLVTYDGRFRIAVEYLLGRVLVVRDRETAARMVPLTGAGTRIVTLDGEVVDGCGPVRGGASASAHLGLLGRKAEIARLRGCVREAECALAALGAKRDGADEETKRLRRLVDGRGVETRELERRFAKAKTDRDSLEKESVRLESERLSASAELDGAARDRDALAAEIKELSGRLESLEAAEREAKRTAEELGSGIDAADAESARCEKDLADRRTSFAGLDEKSKGIARQFEQLEREIARLGETLGARRTDLARAEARAKERTDAARSMRGTLAAKRETLESLAAQEVAARARRDDLRAARDSVRTSAREAKDDLQAARAALSDLRVAASQTTMKIETLEESTRNELGISLAELAAGPVEQTGEQPAEQVVEGPGDEPDGQTKGSSADDAEPGAAKGEQPGDGGGVEGQDDGQDDDASAEDAPVEQGPVDPEALRARIRERKRKIDGMGRVNLFALEELEELSQRRDFYRAQHEDLAKARKSLNDVINRINKRTKAMFQETFDTVRGHFQELFRKLFHGGKADIFLDLGENEDILEAGIEIVAKPPGREALKLSLLSGGQRALTTIALLFAIFRAKPSPFCVLDEVDAPLDEANVERFCGMLREHSSTTQFIVVTHHKVTMEAARTLYGITMEEKGVSKKVSVLLKDIGATLEARTPEGGEIVKDGPFSQMTRAA